MSAAIISPKSFQEPGGCIPGKVILRTLFCFCVGISPTKCLVCFRRRFSRRLSTRSKQNRSTGRNEKSGSCSSDPHRLGKYHWNRLPPFFTSNPWKYYPGPYSQPSQAAFRPLPLPLSPLRPPLAFSFGLHSIFCWSIHTYPQWPYAAGIQPIDTYNTAPVKRTFPVCR